MFSLLGLTFFSYHHVLCLFTGRVIASRYMQAAEKKSNTSDIKLEKVSFTDQL